MKILMCPPDYYGVEYEINPWMNMSQPANHELAVKQWENLYNTLRDCGAEIHLIKPERGSPDMTFTANAGLLYQNKMILSRFKFKERQGEEPHFFHWFAQAGFHTVNYPPLEPEKLFFEGAGDALSAGETLFCGYGFRTARNFYQQSGYFHQDHLIYCELVNPYFYHIDTCFCPLNAKTAIWFPDAFSQHSQQEMSKKLDLIAVNEEEAKKFACNAVVIDEHVIIPSGCPQLFSDLQKRGFTPHACDMTEYMKAGGACKCLTLRID